MGGKKAYRPPTPWEIAKPLLEKDYLENRATDDMAPRDVIKLRPEEYGAVKVEHFRSNWAAMKKRIREHKARALEDAEFLAHDVQLYTLAKDDPASWHGSDAERLLKLDLNAFAEDNRLPDDMKPKKLWGTRVEYGVFELEVFRKHVYQEFRSRVETPYWKYKMKKKALRKTSTLAEGEVEDDHLDFFYDPVLDL